jgi:hypothetical protein
MMEGAALAIIYPKRRNGFHEGWVAVAQDPMLKLAQSDLGGEALRVLMVLLAKLDFENWINLTQTEISKLSKISRPNVARSMRKLVEEGVLLPGPKVGRNMTWRLNPSYGWKGSARSHNEALLDRMKARGLSVVDGGGTPEPSRDPNTPDMFEV